MTPNLQPQDDRDSDRLAWARQALGDGGATLQRASVDAGHRSYWRSSEIDQRHIGKTLLM